LDKFNHYMLTLARESRGLTQGALSDLVNVGQGTVSKYENGISEPPDSFVSELSRALGYPVSFFHQQGQAYGFPPFHYRRRKKLSAKALGRIVAEMNIRRMHVSRLAVAYKFAEGFTIPEIDLDEYQGRSLRAASMDDYARSVREAWMLPNGPIENMVELIERSGGIVIPCEFGTDLLDAMSQRIDGMPVLFFVNTNSPTDRVRYTLAHELAHMILHTATLKDDEDMEDEADQFAGAFLLPEQEIRVQLRRFDLHRLANMKAHWKVSMQAIATRASRLGLITPHQSKMFWIEMGKLGYRKREPNPPPKEAPKLLQRMVDFHRKRLGYSDAELADLLRLSETEFQSMYAPNALILDDSPQYLRRVK